jgi:hypothetical protein
MSEPNHPEVKGRATIHMVPMVECPRPNDMGTLILKREFETLCQGDTNKDESKCNNSKNLFYAALLGLIGVLASTDWETFSIRRRHWPFYLCVVGFTAAIAWFGAEWRTFRHNIQSRSESSVYMQLRREIEERFSDATNVSVTSESRADAPK